LILTGNHIKAARALGDLDQEALAKMADVSVNTIRNMEASGGEPVGGFESTRLKVQTTLEKMGMEFTNGDSPGVRYVKTRKGKKKG
jgi:DNA-binding transcriptional regulator YiaG